MKKSKEERKKERERDKEREIEGVKLPRREGSVGNITEWTGKTMSDSLRRVKDIDKWRGLFTRYSDAPTVIPTTG